MPQFIEALEIRLLFAVTPQTLASDFSAVASAEKALTAVSLKSAFSPKISFARHHNHTGHHGAQIAALLAAFQKSASHSAGILTTDQRLLGTGSLSKSLALEKSVLSLFKKPTSASLLGKVTTGETTVNGLANSNTLSSTLTNAVQTFSTSLNNIVGVAGSDTALITAIQNAEARAQQQANAEMSEVTLVQSSLLTLEQDAIAAVKLIKGG